MKKNEITWKRTLIIWWPWAWRFLVLLVTLDKLIEIIPLNVEDKIGVIPYTITYLILSNAIISMILFKYILQKQFKEFRIALIANEEVKN